MRKVTITHKRLMMQVCETTVEVPEGKQPLQQFSELRDAGELTIEWKDTDQVTYLSSDIAPVKD